jgi:hypothetical protein
MNDILSVDFGFGNVKAITPEGKILFPSAFYRDDNDMWHTGEKAIETGRPRFPVTIEDLTRLYPVVILTLMSRLKTRPRIIACGLPLETYSTYSTGMQYLLEREVNFAGQIEKIVVYPQTASCAWMFDVDSLFIVDIGFNTVISCLMRKKEIVYHKTFFHYGAMVIGEKLLPRLSKVLSDVGKTLTLPEIEQIVRTGKFQVGLEVYDYTDLIKELREEYIRETIAMVISDLKANGPGTAYFSHLAVIGGLAKDVSIHSRKVEIIIPPEPVYANAMSFMIRARENA